MKTLRVRVWLAIVVGGLATTTASAAGTIKEAEQLSKRTGRPILAVAGSKT